MELIKSFLASQGLVYAAGSIGAIVIAWILKKIPNNKIKLVFGRLMYGLGVALTLGLSKWKLTVPSLSVKFSFLYLREQERISSHLKTTLLVNLLIFIPSELRTTIFQSKGRVAKAKRAQIPNNPPIK